MIKPHAGAVKSSTASTQTLRLLRTWRGGAAPAQPSAEKVRQAYSPRLAQTRPAPARPCAAAASGHNAAAARVVIEAEWLSSAAFDAATANARCRACRGRGGGLDHCGVIARRARRARRAFGALVGRVATDPARHAAAQSSTPLQFAFGVLDARLKRPDAGRRIADTRLSVNARKPKLPQLW